MEMEGGDRKFSIGQHKGKTFAQVARDVEYVQWCQAQPAPSAQLRDFMTWFTRYYVIQEGRVEPRASLGIPEGTYAPRSKAKGANRKPPNPPVF